MEHSPKRLHDIRQAEIHHQIAVVDATEGFEAQHLGNGYAQHSGLPPIMDGTCIFECSVELYFPHGCIAPSASTMQLAWTLASLGSSRGNCISNMSCENMQGNNFLSRTSPHTAHVGQKLDLTPFPTNPKQSNFHIRN